MDQKFISKFLKGSISTSTGTIVTVLFHFLSITVMTRQLTPESLGQYFLILATAMLLKVLCSAGLDLTMVKYLSDQKSGNEKMISSIFISRMIIILTVGLITFIFDGILTPLLGEGYQSFLLFIPFIFAGHSIREFFLYLLQGVQHFKHYALLQIISAIFKFGLILILFNQLSVTMLLYVEIAMLVFSIGLLAFWVPFKQFGISLMSFNQQDIKEALQFGLPLYYTSVIRIGYSKSSVFLINYFLNPINIAIFEVALKIPDGFSRLFKSFMTVFFPSASTLFAEGKSKEAVRLMNKSISFFSIGCTTLCVGAFLFRDEIVSLVFSAQYAAASLPFAFLLTAVYFRLIGNILGYALVSAGFPSTSSKVNTLSLIVYLIFSLLLIPRIGVMGAVYAIILMNSSAIIAYFFYLKREQLTPNITHFLFPTLIGILPIGLNELWGSQFLTFRIGFFILYLGLLALFLPEFQDTYKFVKTILRQATAKKVKTAT